MALLPCAYRGAAGAHPQPSIAQQVRGPLVGPFHKKRQLLPSMPPLMRNGNSSKKSRRSSSRSESKECGPYRLVKVEACNGSRAANALLRIRLRCGGHRWCFPTELTVQLVSMSANTQIPHSSTMQATPTLFGSFRLESGKWTLLLSTRKGVRGVTYPLYRRSQTRKYISKHPPTVNK